LDYVVVGLAGGVLIAVAVRASGGRSRRPDRVCPASYEGLALERPAGAQVVTELTKSKAAELFTR
jgi:hypothetical protein